jgi:hypothetical protein
MLSYVQMIYFVHIVRVFFLKKNNKKIYMYIYSAVCLIRPYALRGMSMLSVFGTNI